MDRVQPAVKKHTQPRNRRGVKPCAGHNEIDLTQLYAKHDTGLPKGQPAKKGYGGARRRWDVRCTTCLGKREIRGISGYYPCPRCCPTTQAQARQAEAEHQEYQRGVTE